LIRNINKPRSDWNAKFKLAAETDDDVPVDTSSRSGFDKKEWQW